MRSAEVVVDFYVFIRVPLRLEGVYKGPCNVRVIDCSSFSSSSVSDRGRADGAVPRFIVFKVMRKR